MNVQHKHDHEKGYEADKDFKAAEYPRYVYSAKMGEKSVELVPKFVETPDAEKALKGSWYEDPNEALEAFGKPKATPKPVTT